MKRFTVVFQIITAFIFFLGSCELLEDDFDPADTRTKIEGQWLCDEDAAAFKSTMEAYPVYIWLDDFDSTKINIDNIVNLGFEVTASVTMNGQQLTIPDQMLKGDIRINGSGEISSNYKTIDWNYSVDIGDGILDSYTAIYTKQ